MSLTVALSFIFLLYPINPEGRVEKVRKQFWKDNSATILTGLGTIGVIVTTALAIKATTKAVQIIEDSKEEKGEELTKSEIVKKVGKIYIPTILSGAATIGCIVGANVLNKKQQASLVSAYALIDNSYKEYKNKLKELYGEEAHQKVVESLAVEKADDIYIHSESLCTNCDLALEEHNSKPKLFYDEYGKRYFEATIEQVITAEYHLNRNYVLRGFSVLNEFYEFLGLEPTKYGSVVGWAPLDDGMYWIDFNHHKAVLEDGRECYIIEMPFAPSANYNEY